MFVSPIRDSRSRQSAPATFIVIMAQIDTLDYLE